MLNVIFHHPNSGYNGDKLETLYRIYKELYFKINQINNICKEYKSSCLQEQSNQAIRFECTGVDKYNVPNVTMLHKM